MLLKSIENIDPTKPNTNTPAIAININMPKLMYVDLLDKLTLYAKLYHILYNHEFLNFEPSFGSFNLINCA